MNWTATDIIKGECECGSDLSVEIVDGQPCVYCIADKRHLHEPIPMYVALEVDEFIGFMDVAYGLHEEDTFEMEATL